MGTSIDNDNNANTPMFHEIPHTQCNNADAF